MYAKVLIDIKHEEVNRFFDYAVPASFQDDIQRGMRVIVPFGNQERMGYVIQLIEDSQKASKDIIALLDIIPTIQAETFMFIDHIISQTNDLYSAVFETVVPAEIGLDYYQEIRLIKPEMIDQEFISLFDKNGFLKLSKSNHTHDKIIRKYLRQKAIEVRPSWRQKMHEKKLYMYAYNPQHTYHRIDAYPQISTIKNGSYTSLELNQRGLSDSQINTLVKHDVLHKEKQAVSRDIKHVYQKKEKDIILTKEQQIAYEELYHHGNKNQVFLLKGITGSGKTELYLKWIADQIKNHKQVLILVPEIMLIAPMAQRLESIFGGIAIYHSGLSKGERFDQYMRVKKGEINIVLGTRSAVFLPLDELGLIILDEEHDASYQQIEKTIYDARDIAKLRAVYHQCPLVLGSATPSIVSMHQAFMKTYHLLTLNKRPFGLKEPAIELVDMREELRLKNTSIFSRRLKMAIKDRLSKHEQTMILFNRKGYAPFVMCRQCGDVPTCPTCGIALTYYKDSHKLSCHYCGYQTEFQQTCAVCHHDTLKPVGVGIEHVEQQIHKNFPQAKVIRMDANQTRTKGAHEIIWQDFQDQKADILLGTQMIAKGLDFPNVTLVGVLMADLMLRTPSYKAAEETYTLLMQVAGRSGRARSGEVIIQGYDLDHYAIKDVLSDYDSFYQEALYERKINGYEPFKHVHQILAEGSGYLKTYQFLFQLKKAIEKTDGWEVLGPVPAFIKKKHDRFRFMITIKTVSTDLNIIFETMTTMKHEDVIFRYYPISALL